MFPKHLVLLRRDGCPTVCFSEGRENNHRVGINVSCSCPLTFLYFRNQNGILSWILTVPMARPSTDTRILFFICLIRAVASLWMLIWLRVTIVRHLEKCLMRGTFCRNLTSANHGRANAVSFPWGTGGWLRLKATVLCVGQLWGFPHVERCKSVVLTSNRSDLPLLLACKLIYIYTDCVQILLLRD